MPPSGLVPSLQTPLRPTVRHGGGGVNQDSKWGLRARGTGSPSRGSTRSGTPSHDNLHGHRQGALSRGSSPSLPDWPGLAGVVAGVKDLKVTLEGTPCWGPAVTAHNPSDRSPHPAHPGGRSPTTQTPVTHLHTRCLPGPPAAAGRAPAPWAGPPGTRVRLCGERAASSLLLVATARGSRAPGAVTGWTAAQLQGQWHRCSGSFPHLPSAP